MNFPKPNWIMQMLLLIFVLTLLSACGPVKTEPQFINVKPKVEPLSAETLQAIQADSTPLLKKADHWYENSGKLLDSVTDKSTP